MSTQILMRLGIIAMRKDPPRLATSLVTYKHPTVPGLTVQLKPMPTIAGAHYWDAHWYDQHTKFDRVLVEDDRLPVRSGTFDAQMAQMRRVLFPFTGHAMTVNDDVQAGRYDQAQSFRDRFDSTLAYKTVVEMQDPPTDPRARRAVDHLNSIADGMKSSGVEATPHKIVMPWSVYHCYYLNWRLRTEGWEVVSTEEEVMIHRQQVAWVMLFMAFSTFFAIYAMIKMVGWILFG
uniref:Uncharacterized protein n=1 Tax=Neobodo designis TaxID=312471 RepID=A0A7S1Q6C5_NEODS|mmetsp:Transcript_3302/g.10260  ORF Transcript_3302/g.10260 Transcript_3302/m.10260 type:complete len:233 (+) Transcript_3302:62-760(+)